MKTKKAGEAISGHFAGAILPKVNEDFRGKCSSLMYAFSNKRFSLIGITCLY